jgi:hypothetical protein
MTDLGELHWLLGMEVKRDRSNRMGSISQTAYIDHICEKFNLQDAKPLSTPLDPRNHLSKSQSPSTPKQIDDMCGVPYREAVGSLMYAAIGIQPDIAFTVTALSQYLIGAGHAHWEQVKRVFRYLKDTRTLGITYCYGLSTRALKSRILEEVSPKENSRDDQQETLLVALIDDNAKLTRRPYYAQNPMETKLLR